MSKHHIIGLEGMPVPGLVSVHFHDAGAVSTRPLAASVLILFGVAERDPGELVCMIFEDKPAMDSFIETLPGRYLASRVYGIDYNQIEIDHDSLARPEDFKA